jgi:hypothetical protein
MAAFGMMTLAAPMMTTAFPSATPVPSVALATLVGPSVLAFGAVLVGVAAVVLAVRLLVGRRDVVRNGGPARLHLAA